MHVCMDKDEMERIRKKTLYDNKETSAMKGEDFSVTFSFFASFLSLSSLPPSHSSIIRHLLFPFLFFPQRHLVVHSFPLLRFPPSSLTRFAWIERHKNQITLTTHTHTHTHGAARLPKWAGSTILSFLCILFLSTISFLYLVFVFFCHR